MLVTTHLKRRLYIARTAVALLRPTPAQNMRAVASAKNSTVFGLHIISVMNSTSAQDHRRFFCVSSLCNMRAFCCFCLVRLLRQLCVCGNCVRSDPIRARSAIVRFIRSASRRSALVAAAARVHRRRS